MTKQEAKKVMETEKRCVERNIKCECDRDCAKCDLLIKDDDVLHGYDTAIKALEEVTQYRAIGTVEELKQLKEDGAFTGLELAQIAIGQMKLKEYHAIGTVEECRKAMDIINSMLERGIGPDVLEAYVWFEKELIKNGFTVKGILEMMKKQNADK